MEEKIILHGGLRWKHILQHEELWECVVTEEKRKMDPKKDVNTMSKIILLIEPQLYVHVQEVTTAKMVWDNLSRAFEDSGLFRTLGRQEGTRPRGRSPLRWTDQIEAATKCSVCECISEDCSPGRMAPYYHEHHS
ncbi:hypothetical protein ACJJTC_005417 [Scirpophaga incertulas]